MISADILRRVAQQLPQGETRRALFAIADLSDADDDRDQGIHDSIMGEIEADRVWGSDT